MCVEVVIGCNDKSVSSFFSIVFSVICFLCILTFVFVSMIVFIEVEFRVCLLHTCVQEEALA